MKNNEKFTEKAEGAIEQARLAAFGLGHSYVGTEHLLLGILRQPDCGGVRAIVGAGLEPNDIYTDIMSVFGTGSFKSRPQQSGSVRTAVKHSETRILDQYSRDLTQLAASGGIDPL